MLPRQINVCIKKDSSVKSLYQAKSMSTYNTLVFIDGLDTQDVAF